MPREEETTSGGNMQETDNNRTAMDRHHLFSALLFGRPHHEEDTTIISAAAEDSTASHHDPQQKEKSHPDTQNKSRTPSSTSRTRITETDRSRPETEPQQIVDTAAEDGSSLLDRLEGVLTQIDQQIPHDPIALRQTTLYQGALQMLQWQRDNYLVGTEYADWRRKDLRRQREQPQPRQQTVRGVGSSINNNNNIRYDIPFDPTALSHPQLAKIASDFVPTPTVVKALTPIVAGLPAGALYDPIRDSTVAIIHGQQSNLEGVVKNRLLQFLNNPQNRAAMKTSTQGMLVRGSQTTTTTTTTTTTGSPAKDTMSPGSTQASDPYPSD